MKTSRILVLIALLLCLNNSQFIFSMNDTMQNEPEPRDQTVEKKEYIIGEKLLMGEYFAGSEANLNNWLEQNLSQNSKKNPLLQNAINNVLAHKLMWGNLEQYYAILDKLNNKQIKIEQKEFIINSGFKILQQKIQNNDWKMVNATLKALEKLDVDIHVSELDDTVSKKLEKTIVNKNPLAVQSFLEECENYHLTPHKIQLIAAWKFMKQQKLALNKKLSKDLTSNVDNTQLLIDLQREQFEKILDIKTVEISALKDKIKQLEIQKSELQSKRNQTIKELENDRNTKIINTYQKDAPVIKLCAEVQRALYPTLRTKNEFDNGDIPIIDNDSDNEEVVYDDKKIKKQLTSPVVRIILKNITT